jgi:hypothetical protein
MINKLHIRLRELRREREMTQQDLAKAILSRALPITIMSWGSVHLTWIQLSSWHAI